MTPPSRLAVILGVVFGPIVIGLLFLWFPVTVSILVVGLALLATCAALRRRARSLATARTYAAPDPGGHAPLEAGDRTISGRVEGDDGDAALRVEIVQVYHQHLFKGGKYHSWDEVQRTVTSAPFVVVTDAGERVCVEPDDSTLFWDDPGAQTTPAATSVFRQARSRVATLPRGARAWVTGRLQRSAASDAAPPDDYRAPAVEEGWVMRAPPALLVTTGTLAAHHRQRAAMHGRHALFYACLLALVSLVPLGWADRELGSVEQGTITSIERFRRKDHTTGWTFQVATPSGIVSGASSVRPRLHDTRPVRRGRFTSIVGETNQSTALEISLFTLATYLLFFAGWLLLDWSVDQLPWYRRPGKKFVEKGPGHLP